MQTRNIVLGVMRCDVPVEQDLRLREMCKGGKGLADGLEGSKRKEVKTLAYREAYRQLGWNFRHGSQESGGETAREAGLRFLAAMQMIADGQAMSRPLCSRMAESSAMDWVPPGGSQTSAGSMPSTGLTTARAWLCAVPPEDAGSLWAVCPQHNVTPVCGTTGGALKVPAYVPHTLFLF